MKKTVSLLIELVFTWIFLFAATAGAAYVSVEDFEGYSLGGVAGYDLNGTPIVGSPNPTSLWRTNDNSQYAVVDDRSGGSARVLHAGGNSTKDVATLPALPDIADNTTATVYFRMKVLSTASTAGYNRRLGPSGPPVSPPTLSDPTTGLFLSGSDFKPQNSSESLSFANANCWWSFWIVVNNSTNTYTIYYQREDGGSQGQLAANKAFSGSLAGPTSPITDFYLFRWAGPSFYLDDIYIDTSGVNLTRPQIPTPQVLTKVGSIVGAEGLTVHSPGDAITVTVGFHDPVTLSQAGGAKLELNISGARVDAVHTGSLTGASLAFAATAPAMTTMSVRVVANSLQLLNGATLRDSISSDVDLRHGEVPLPDDQISVEGLSVYAPVQDLPPSPRYSFRVHQVGSGQWLTPFAWFTECKPWIGVDDKYYSNFIGGWSNTYCNFEMANSVPVEVEITKLDPSTGRPVAIQKAVPHPRRKVNSWRIEGGKAYVVFSKPVLFAVDIDGQMDEHVAPRIADQTWSGAAFPYLNENAFHTVTIFANPFILDKPVLGAPGVYAVEPGVIPPDDGSWTTLYFKPGVHKLFPGELWGSGTNYYDFRVRSNKSYYIPGDAIVYGNMNNRFDESDGRNIRVFGHGTLSGAKTLHADDMSPPLPDSKRTRTLQIDGGEKVRIEGLTFADSPGHTCKILADFNTDPADLNYVRWCKVFSWRANGDGITVKGSSYLEDCFMRHQDDGTYVRGLGIRRIVYWTDANGAPLRCSFIGSDRGSDYPASLPDRLYVEDIDVIYGRRAFWDNASKAAISLPGFGSEGGNTASHVVFRNINYEDPLPMRKLFGFDTTESSGDVAGIRFENIRAVAPSVFGNTDTSVGSHQSHIRNLIFNNVILAGQHYDSLDDFTHNSYVHDFVFESTAPETMTYLNTSGLGKWYIKNDWSGGVEPANNDMVNHTSVASVLTVDAPAYAGSLNIAHANTATVSVGLGGKLDVTLAVSLGAVGSGKLNLLDGTLKLQNSLGSALSITNGNIHIESGTLLWAGNHISTIQTLYAAGKLTLAGGRADMLSASAALIGQVGPSRLYADYNHATPGYTTVWVVTKGHTSLIDGS